MTKAASDALAQIESDKRILLYSRASTVGAHRYGGIWTGDCCSWWSHLEMQIKMIAGLNMCGFLYTGSDTGGFGADTSRDLVLRWTAFSAFTPAARQPLLRISAFSTTTTFKSVLSPRVIAA